MASSNSQMNTNEIRTIVEEVAKHPVKEDANSTPYCLHIEANDLLAVAKTLYEHPQLYFDSLSCLTGIDNGKEAGTMEVMYHFYSIPFHYRLALKVVLPRDKPAIESLSHLWRAANWQEREVFDMYGIHFSNHPDLRRILMPADWEGFPLRKDYQHQEEYRGITVKYTD
jgi:NADH-quinone oxidoreductase subunit C